MVYQLIVKNHFFLNNKLRFIDLILMYYIIVNIVKKKKQYYVMNK